MEKHYYNQLLQGDGGALKRTLYESMGFTGESLSKPLIAIANTYTNATPGHYGIDELYKQAERGIEAAGGTAMTFGTIAPCDRIAGGHDGMRYILPSRDLIISSMGCVVRAHKFDGLVLLGSCGKTMPGLLMAAARLDIPAVFCNNGPMVPAVYKGKYYDGNIVTGAVGWKQHGEIDETEFEEIENPAEPCAGSCAMLGTTSTMGCMAEAPGVSLPGSTIMPAIYAKRMQIVYETDRAVMEMVRRGVTARQIITKQSIENAITVLMGTGGSTDAIVHLQVIHKEAGLGPLPLETSGIFGRDIPQMALAYPASPYDMADFYEAGGVPVVMTELRDRLHTDCMTVSDRTVERNLNQELETTRREVIKTAKEPFHPNGGVSVLTGNMTPLGAAVKPTAIPEHLLRFTGTANVYRNEQEACAAVLNGEVKPGTMVVLRYEGSKGGPGMSEMYRPMRCLEGMNLSDSCAVVTDGRFSGSNRGCFVGHISPEAYEGGVLALVEDGDVIRIDVPGGELSLLADEAVLEERERRWAHPEKELPDGYLSAYQKISRSVAEGAVVK